MNCNVYIWENCYVAKHLFGGLPITGPINTKLNDIKLIICPFIHGCVHVTHEASVTCVRSVSEAAGKGGSRDTGER